MLPVLSLAIDAALAMLALAVLPCLARLLRGPRAVDRLLALDALTLLATLALVLWGLRSHSALYADVALVMAPAALLGTVAACRLLRATGPAR